MPEQQAFWNNRKCREAHVEMLACSFSSKNWLSMGAILIFLLRKLVINNALFTAWEASGLLLMRDSWHDKHPAMVARVSTEELRVFMVPALTRELVISNPCSHLVLCFASQNENWPLFIIHSCACVGVLPEHTSLYRELSLPRISRYSCFYS